MSKERLRRKIAEQKKIRKELEIELQRLKIELHRLRLENELSRKQFELFNSLDNQKTSD